MRVILTGSEGYIGRVLRPKLEGAGHEVIGIDIGWFGGSPDIKADIRELKELPRAEALIHLAAIANDPCGDLDAKLTWEVNVLGSKFLADLAQKANVGMFVFASSASVYGLKDNRPVAETDSLEPVSDYNKTKMCAERILRSYGHLMTIAIVRPATVCGLSPRMRLDTMVNMLTLQALETGVIRAHCGEHGGGLMRPNIHIEDITDLYVWALNHMRSGTWNAGFENISAADTAQMIAEETGARIEITTVKDKRSYAVDSSKLLAAGFEPKHTVRDAIREIAHSYRAGALRRHPNMLNLEWMRSKGLAKQ